MGIFRIKEPPLSIQISPKTKGDQEKLLAALQQFSTEDPDFNTDNDPVSGMVIVRGVSELYLDILVERLIKQFAVQADFGAPQVEYRETPIGDGDADYIYESDHCGERRFAQLQLTVFPDHSVQGATINNNAKGFDIPIEYLDGIERGIRSVLESGPLHDHPVIGARVVLQDVSYNANSSALAFEIAARMALRKAFRKTGMILLEPVMRTNVLTPKEFAQSVINDLVSRRGQIQEHENRADLTFIKVLLPSSNSFGMLNTLRSLTSGRAYIETMQYSHHAPVPNTHTDPDDRPPVAAALRA